jgi:hypothetical protein
VRTGLAGKDQNFASSFVQSRPSVKSATLLCERLYSQPNLDLVAILHSGGRRS